MRRLLRDYNLSLTLMALFLTSWALQAWFQVRVEAEPWSAFWAATLENWQSEFLQLLTFVVLTSFLIHRGSHESKDSDEALRESIDRISTELLKTSFQVDALVERLIDHDDAA